MKEMVVSLAVGVILVITNAYFKKEQEKKNKELLERLEQSSLFFRQGVETAKLELVGIGPDQNSDCEFIEAARKIKLPADKRIKV